MSAAGKSATGGNKSSSGSNSNNNNSNNSVCRDFLRNTCSRGAKCKFRHPESAAATPDHVHVPSGSGTSGVQPSSSTTQQEQQQQHTRQNAVATTIVAAAATGGERHQDTIVFCHDFQNLTCQRGHCRFLHCSRAEEEDFRNTGYLPPHLRDQVVIMHAENTVKVKENI